MIVFQKRLLLKNKLIPFFIIFDLNANENITELVRMKENIISNYIERIEIAKDKGLDDRENLLNETLSCIISSKTKKDITNFNTCYIFFLFLLLTESLPGWSLLGL